MAQHLMVPLQMASKVSVPRAHAAPQDLCSNTLFLSSSRAQKAGFSLFCSSVNPTLDTPDVLGVMSLGQLCLDPWSNWPAQVTSRCLQGPSDRAQVATTC